MMRMILEKLTDENLVKELLSFMEEHCSDFPECRKNYEACMTAFKMELGTEVEVTTDELAKAIEKQIASELTYFAYLGFRANLDYFKNPVANNFLNVDPETYLRETTARHLPAHSAAQSMQDAFYKQLTAEQRERSIAIVEYVSYLETVGPKLAHYYGFLFANEFLTRVEPAYLPSRVFTHAYRRRMEDYMQIKLKGCECFTENESAVGAEASNGTMFSRKEG